LPALINCFENSVEEPKSKSERSTFYLAKRREWWIIKKRLRNKKCPHKGFDAFIAAIFNACHHLNQR
jgi:hypothetical protein